MSLSFFNEPHKFLWKGSFFEVLPEEVRNVNLNHPFSTTVVIKGHVVLLKRHLERVLIAAKKSWSDEHQKTLNIVISFFKKMPQEFRLRITWVEEDFLFSFVTSGNRKGRTQFSLLQDPHYPKLGKSEQFYKQTDYDFRLLESSRRGILANNAVWLSREQTILEATFSNLVFEKDNFFTLPKPQPGIFCGMSQQFFKTFLLGKNLSFDERDIGREEIPFFDRFGVLNSYHLLKWSTRLENHSFQLTEDCRRMEVEFEEWIIQQN